MMGYIKQPLRNERELGDWVHYMRSFDLTQLEIGYGSKAVFFTDDPCSDKVAYGRQKNQSYLLRFALFSFCRNSAIVFLAFLW